MTSHQYLLIGPHYITHFETHTKEPQLLTNTSVYCLQKDIVRALMNLQVINVSDASDTTLFTQIPELCY